MSDSPKVLLSGFADEAAWSKTAEEQLSVFAALGLRHYSLRFIDLGEGIKNVMALTDAEIDRLLKLNDRYGLKVATIGSPLGKVKLVDRDDGTGNRFVPFEQYLNEDVARAIDLAGRFGTKLIRGFSFYHPKGSDPEEFFDQTVRQLKAVAAACGEAGVVYGLEIEANLMGQSGESMRRLAEGVGDPNMVLIFDGANISCQNIPAEQVFDQYLAMRDDLGWLHVKDYRIDPSLVWEGHVDEERLKNFVPADVGDSGHHRVLADLKDHLPKLTDRITKLGAPGFFMDLEPHLRGGGQFGGFSGPDGMGVALRALCRVLDDVGIAYDLRDHAGMG